MSHPLRGNADGDRVIEAPSESILGLSISKVVALRSMTTASACCLAGPTWSSQRERAMSEAMRLMAPLPGDCCDSPSVPYVLFPDQQLGFVPQPLTSVFDTERWSPDPVLDVPTIRPTTRADYQEDA